MAKELQQLMVRSDTAAITATVAGPQVGDNELVLAAKQLLALTGGGANLKLGQHLVLPKDTPLCNVWLTMLNGLGIKTDRHGDSSGIVKELQA